MVDKHRPSGALEFFEIERVYPDEDARVWYEHLVGLDEHKRRLLVELELLLVFRPRFRGHRVDGNRLVRRMTEILGIPR